MSNERPQVYVTPYRLPCKSEYDTFLECHPNTHIEPRIILVTILVFKRQVYLHDNIHKANWTRIWN